MRLARKLFLLVAMALAALAMSATTASATGSVEVHNEAGVHCNPCVITAVGESQIKNNLGTVLSTCEDTFTAEVYENGEGHVTSLVNQGHAGNPCTTLKCNGVGEPGAETEWPFEMEEIAPETEQIEIRFCLDVAPNPNGTGLHCDLDGTVGEETGVEDHHYTISTTNFPCAGGLRVITGSWEISGTPIEVEHPPV